MTKIVIGQGYGFMLSQEAIIQLADRGVKVSPEGFTDPNTYLRRDHPALVEVVELLGEKADTKDCRFLVVEVPDDADWVIDECEGTEQVLDFRYIWPTPPREDVAEGLKKS